MITPIYCKINQILLHPPPPPPPILRPNCRSRSCPFRLRCHSMRSDDGGSGDRYANGEGRPQETPALIRVAVNGATELLKVFSLLNVETERLSDSKEFENSTSSVDDVVRILKSDYERDYLVTGVFTSDIYTEDCIFEDPTIKFQGNALYERNLKLLVPFFSQPSIELLSIEKHGSINMVKMRERALSWLNGSSEPTWRPLISIDGSTAYDLNDNFKVIDMKRVGVPLRCQQLDRLLLLALGNQMVEGTFYY